MYCVMEDGLRISLCDFARANICAAIGELVSPNGHPLHRLLTLGSCAKIEPSVQAPKKQSNRSAVTPYPNSYPNIEALLEMSGVTKLQH